MTYQDERSGDKGITCLGELNIGRPQFGKESSLGEGSSYVHGMKVLSTDNTAGAASDGGNFIDEASAAQSLTGSTFSFQGTTANHSILFCSTLSGSNMLKHYGIRVAQTTAAVEVTPKSFIVEIWNGSAWTEVNTMSTNALSSYRYGNELFIRGNTSEHIRFGLDDNTTWALKTINGTLAYWARIRIIANLTTAPVFQQFKLSCSRFKVSINGTNTYHGNARFVHTLLGAGNIFGEEGAVGDTTTAVGSGGIPTGWSHNFKNSNMNGNGDAVHTQFTLPRGIDTSYPLTFRAILLPKTVGADDVTLIMSVLPLELQGIDVADPSGGSTPVARTLANTETITSKAAQTSTVTNFNADDKTKVRSQEFSGFDVSDYYEGDLLLCRLELDNDGASTNADIILCALEVSGLKWTLGERL